VPAERKRAPRGANLKAVMAVLQDPSSPRQGLSASQVVAETGLSFSSAQAALKQAEEAGLAEQVDNFWRPKAEAKSDEEIAAEVARNGNVTT
jgi:transposase